MNSNERRLLFLALSLFGIFTATVAWVGHWKIIAISWIAFAAMAGAIPLGRHASQKKNLRYLVSSYGLASGAMITSACIFLVPAAVNQNALFGGLGIAAGIISGFGIHTLNHGLAHYSFAMPPVVLELTSHALAAGVVIGLVYAAMPSLGLLLGVAIVSHKGPAGYAAATRLSNKGRSANLLLLPACALGLTALPVSLLTISASAIVNAIIFGFATGIFLHVAIDFLPECEVGGKIHQDTNLKAHTHDVLDRHRNRAVISTFMGGIIVFLAWWMSV